MLDDPKALTRIDRNRLIPCRPEQMSDDEIEDRISKVEEAAADPRVFTLNRALELAGLTSSKWQSMFGVCKKRELEHELDRIEYLKQQFENRIFESALVNQTNATMAIFALKNHHGWSDKQNIEIQATSTTKVDVSDMDEVLKKELAERYLKGSVLSEDR